ncbi:hypothetical protein CL618_02190 [archaeon]|nr:hypothetical protein [archaeon]|tara:strand:- start:1914 stop:3554 length:1641 start_codon:yes stop_codon:yes gene_type:complete
MKENIEKENDEVEKLDKEINKNELEDRKDKLKGFLTNKNLQTYLIIALIVFAIILRLFYFNVDQAVWWDSADYLAGAKVIGQDLELNHYEFNPRRPFFLSAFWGFLYLIGGGETFLRISMLLFSIAGVWLTYLLGKEIYNKNVGLLAGFAMAVSWLHLFHTARLLSDLPALAIWLSVAYFSYKGIMNKDKKSMIFAGISLGFLLFIRGSSLIYFFPLLVLVLGKDNWKFFKNKYLWLALLIALVIMSPFWIWLSMNYDNPFQKFTGIGGDEVRFVGSMDFGKLWSNLDMFSSVVFSPKFLAIMSGLFLSAKILGLLVFFLVLFLSLDVFLGFDLLIKGKSKGLVKKIFLLTWMFTPYVFFSLAGSGIEPRYVFPMFPALFIILGKGIMDLKLKFKKYKYVWLGLLIVLLIVFGTFQLGHASALTKAKKDSYRPVKEGGVWLYEHTDENDIIVSQSHYQNMYYSERDTFDFHGENGKLTEEEFNLKVKELRPKYMVVSVFEPAFTPEWVYSYGERNKDKVVPVMGYNDGSGNPLLLIFEFIGEYKSE